MRLLAPPDLNELLDASQASDGGRRGAEDEVAIRAGVLVRQSLGADADRWTAAIQLLTDGLAGTLPELLAASRHKLEGTKQPPPDR